ncbi:hypothetical protein [Alkaliphilus metalliredigens]|uniref:hypothetical protein n=1 Tax=Alkaliphilus metalliredigens TaxID=208226 RepID=UPI0002EF6042|nr:hypothetical protein [Alkaliphilus metalliredigens]
MNKVWLKKCLELIFNVSIISTTFLVDIKEYTVSNPWYPIASFFALLSGFTLYSLKEDSNEELKIDTIFLLVNPLIIGIFIRFVFHESLNFKFIIINFVNYLFVIIIYLGLREPFFTLYKRIGKWAILVHIITGFVLLILVLLNANIFLRVIIPFSTWIILVLLTWNSKNQTK